MKDCGAELIDSISYRGAYALVGRKGGAALSETGRIVEFWKVLGGVGDGW